METNFVRKYWSEIDFFSKFIGVVHTLVSFRILTSDPEQVGQDRTQMSSESDTKWSMVIDFPLGCHRGPR